MENSSKSASIRSDDVDNDDDDSMKPVKAHKTMEPKYKIDPVVAALIESNPFTYEKFLIMAFIQSFKFYRKNRGYLCPMDRFTRVYRHDFYPHKYNQVFELIDTYWRLNEYKYHNQDAYIPPKDLHKMVVEQFKNPPTALWITQAPEIVNDINNVYYAEKIPPEALEKLGGSALQHWVAPRLPRQSSASCGVEVRVQPAQSPRMIANPGHPAAVLSGVTKTIVAAPERIRCLWSPKLNDALEGGFAAGESTLIGGVTGSGKTLLANQLALDFAMQGLNVVLISTEQEPHELIARNVSNFANIPFHRVNDQIAMPTGNCFLSSFNLRTPIPDEPRMPVAQSLERLKMVGRHIYFVDWTMPRDYRDCRPMEREVQNANDQFGWDPKVIIFDWIGGSLQCGDSIHQWVRYKSAADSIVRFGEQHRKVMICMAQLNMKKARNRSRTDCSMLSECKEMADNMHYTMALTYLPNTTSNQSPMAPKQQLNVRKGNRGRITGIPLLTQFDYQRFVEFNQCSPDE